MTTSKKTKRFLEQEYKKCSEDVCYMARNYCDIQTVQHGKIKIDLYPFQETILTTMYKNPKIIINKSRQLGLSTMIAISSVHTILFNPDYKIAIFGNKRIIAQEVVNKIKLIYNGLPTWLKDDNHILIDNKTTLCLSNGSTIEAFTSSSEIARNGDYDRVVMDECAYITDLESLYTSIYSSTRSIMMVSTPAKDSGFFYEHWINAEADKNGFVPIRLKWGVHPDRDEKWRENQNLELGIKLAKQEYDCEFSDNSVSDKTWH